MSKYPTNLRNAVACRKYQTKKNTNKILSKLKDYIEYGKQW